MTNQEKADFFLLINRWFQNEPVVLSSIGGSVRKKEIIKDIEEVKEDPEEKIF